MIGSHKIAAPRAKRSNPRFLLVSNSAPHQTTARLTSALAGHLREQGHEAKVRLRALPPGIWPKLRHLIGSEPRHVALLRRTDVVVTHSPLTLSLPTLIVARLLRRHVLSFVWDLHPESNRVTGTTSSSALLGLFWLAERLAMLLSSRLLISTDDYRPFLGRFGRKALVVPLWPCDPLVDVRTRTEDRNQVTLRIGFAGQINSIRGIADGIDHVLDCWAGEKIELHLFSADPTPEMLAQRASADRRLCIVEHGFVTPDQLQERLGGLDLGWVCLDSGFRLPAFPSKIMTYLCAGLPVLYTGPALPALVRWLDDHRLGTAMAPGATIGPHDIAALRRDFQRRRATYLAEIFDLWGDVGRLL